MQISSSSQLRSLLRSDPTLKLEFLATLSRLFREHGLEVDPAVLAHLTLAGNGVQTNGTHANANTALAGPSEEDDDEDRPPPGPPPAPPPGPPPAPPPGPSPN